MTDDAVPVVDAPAQTAPTPAPAAAAAAAGLNVTRLLAEAAAKTGILWVEAPPERPYAVWFVWFEDSDPRSTGPTAYVVSGPGEQALPFLPGEVVLHLPSKDTGALLLSVKATAAEVAPDSEEWERAVELLKGGRLNAVGDVEAQWRAGCTVHALRPFGRPLEAPGEYTGGSGSRVVPVVKGTTATWRPWHVRGRARALRNRRLG